MKKFLKIFALCAVFTFGVSIVCSAQNAEPVVTADKYNFRNVIASIKESCTLEIVGEIDTKTVSLLGGELKKKRFKGLKLDMSKSTGLENIENWSFSNCYCLNSVILPYGVKIIGKGAFAGDAFPSQIESITIPDTVQNIGDKAFFQCPRLKSIIIPDSVKIIGNNAFDSCHGLESVIIPDNVEAIGKQVFFSCKNLKSIKLGSGVKSIGALAFDYCPNLCEFIIDEKNEHIKFVDGILFNNDESSIICCIFDKDRNSYVIPDGIESIEECAFHNCHFRTITIPDSVKRIEACAFRHCKFESVTITAGLETIEKGVFEYCDFTCINIPSNIKAIEQEAFRGCKNLEYVTIQDGTETIGDRTFQACRKLMSITIPVTVKSIGKEAFKNCTSLETINFTGTQTQWNAIIKASDWNGNCPSDMKINFNYTEH